MECRPRHSAFRGILLLLLCALLATWVKPSRGISARNPQALDLRPAPCMRQGCRQAANWKRARRSGRATKTCGNEDKQRQADTIGSRALQVATCRAQDAYALAPRLPVLADQAEGPQTLCRCPQARLQVQPCKYPQARLQAQTCRCLPQARLLVCRCQQARLQMCTCYPYGLRVREYEPPPVTQPNPWAQDIQAKLVFRSAGPVPSPG